MDPDNTTSQEQLHDCTIDGKLPYLANQSRNLQMQLGSQIQVSSYTGNTARSLHTILVQAKRDTKFATNTKENKLSLVPN